MHLSCCVVTAMLPVGTFHDGQDMLQGCAESSLLLNGMYVHVCAESPDRWLIRVSTL